MSITGGELAGASFVGVGSFKLVKASASGAPPVQALLNRITKHDVTNATGSTLQAAQQEDDSGTAWRVVAASVVAPAVTPGPHPTWSQAYIYGFDTLVDPAGGSRTLVYYNARDGWKGGHEAVGVSRLDSDFLKGGLSGDPDAPR